ncbi:MAG: hypothetical protein II822_06865 [Prevotella sp.]|nr:hypothetical protein [Prevotella sp.]
MNKIAFTFSLWLLLSGCTVSFQQEPNDSAITTIMPSYLTALSILVTILIGWQIWELVKIHNIRNEISSARDSIKTEIERANEKIDKRYSREFTNFRFLNVASRNGLQDHLIMCFNICGKNDDAHISKASALETVVASFDVLSKDEDKTKLTDLIDILIKNISHDEIEKMYHAYCKQIPINDNVNSIFTELLKKTIK